MNLARTILTVLLAAWLPLSCCCRLHALGELFAGAVGAVGVVSERHSGCSGCRQHHEEESNRPRPGLPGGEDCGCGLHDREYVRGAVVGVPELGGDEVVVMAAVVLAPSSFGELARVDRAPLEGCEARMKGRPTLLRLHCALVV